MRLNYLKELIDDLLWRVRTINEKQIIMRNAGVNKMLPVVLYVIETNHLIDTDVVEDINILPWVLAIPVLCVSVLYRTHERHKLAWYNPVQVSVLDSFVVFVFFDIKSPEVIPTEPDCVLEALQTVK